MTDLTIMDYMTPVERARYEAIPNERTMLTAERAVIYDRARKRMKRGALPLTGSARHA